MAHSPVDTLRNVTHSLLYSTKIAYIKFRKIGVDAIEVYKIQRS